MDQIAPAVLPVEDVELGPLEDSFGFLLRMAQLQNFEHFYRELGAFGLRPGEYSVLLLIDLNPGIRQGVLAQRLHIKRAHMTKLIRGFEDQGFVERTVPDEDRRAVELRLTAEGHAFVGEHRPRLARYEEAVRSALSPGEQDQLMALLRKYVGVGGAGS